ncbi:MAG: anti-anti-sigma factor [Phycisphaerae bacterium]|nr:anti-anti-sigma factor [Phycisphaerae bacterium]
MARDFPIDVEQNDGGVVVVRPLGEVDLASSPQLRAKLTELIGGKPTRMILDLSQVSYMDSSGVATLVEAMQQCRRNSATLALAGLQTRVRSVFEIARLDTVFDIQNDLESALKG